jgi:serine/threonine-protein kinase HipA
MREKPTEAFQHLKNAGTAGGAFPKATVALLPDGTLLVGGDVAAAAAEHPQARLGILKLDCEDDPTGPGTDGRMEHAYLKMACACGIGAVRSRVLTEVSNGRSRNHLFLERFDFEPGTSRRRHLLTLAGALHARVLTYGNLLLTTRSLTQDHREVLEAVRRMIFNVRVGNADDHGKNHSFILNEDTRSWTLAPAYDLTLSFSEGRDYSGLFPNTFGVSPRLSSLAAVAADVGVDGDEFLQIDTAVTAAIGRWPEFAALARVPPTNLARARDVHAGLAASLAAEGPARKSKRQKRW